jgi:hypothetical protein
VSNVRDGGGQRLALVVGTSRYEDPSLRQLRAPGTDAQQLAQVLGDPAVGDFDVEMLVDPLWDRMAYQIAELCARLHPSDFLLIYLSCHGLLDSRGRLYYAAANTSRALLAATAVSASWLNERLTDSRAGTQLVLLDCCHSGAFSGWEKAAPDLALRGRLGGRGRAVLTASSATEYSFEGDQAIGEGVTSVFTEAVIEGLRTGDADIDKDGRISVSDLYKYVYRQVTAREPRQTPQLWTDAVQGDPTVATSIRGPVIPPAPLPEHLRVTLESPLPGVRESGVIELAHLLDVGLPGLAVTSRVMLERMRDEDMPRVATLARTALEAPPGGATSQVRQKQAERTQPEAQERAANRSDDPQTSSERPQRDEWKRETREALKHPTRTDTQKRPPRSAPRQARRGAPARTHHSAGEPPAEPSDQRRAAGPHPAQTTHDRWSFLVAAARSRLTWLAAVGVVIAASGSWVFYAAIGHSHDDGLPPAPRTSELFTALSPWHLTVAGVDCSTVLYTESGQTVSTLHMTRAKDGDGRSALIQVRKSGRFRYQLTGAGCAASVLESGGGTELLPYTTEGLTADTPQFASYADLLVNMTPKTQEDRCSAQIFDADTGSQITRIQLDTGQISERPVHTGRSLVYLRTSEHCTTTVRAG